MRFKTFGDQDAPEWILAQIITMCEDFRFFSSYLFSISKHLQGQAQLHSFQDALLPSHSLHG
jgi:hypothetical protein